METTRQDENDTPALFEISRARAFVSMIISHGYSSTQYVTFDSVLSLPGAFIFISAQTSSSNRNLDFKYVEGVRFVLKFWVDL